jgi:hypothetical protein
VLPEQKLETSPLQGIRPYITYDGAM